MTTEAALPIPRPTLTIEDVHRLIGTLVLELDQVRRENAGLRRELARLSPGAEPPTGG